MPRDPQSHRTKPAPEHPSGLQAIDDGPAYLAPAVDVRPSSPARTSMPPVAPSEPGRGDVDFGLPLPAEERKNTMPPPAASDEEAPASIAPDTVDWDRVSHRSDAPRAPLVTIDTAADEAEKTALSRDLAAIGALDERPDRAIERAVGQRTTLARARALRFRLALLEAWAGGAPPKADPSGRGRVLHLDLSIDSMLIAAIADGAPAIFGPASPLPVAAVMVEALRSLRPDLPRMALRDRAAASIARVTIVGFRGALDALSRAATAIPVDARTLALELAARAALVPAIDEHRLGALHDLEKALGLTTGSVAPAIEAARLALGARARTGR